jgi:predicted metalloprotease with PDZ domain
MKTNLGAKVSVILFFFIINIFNIALGDSENHYSAIAYNIQLSEDCRYLTVKTKFKGDFHKKIVIDLPYQWGDKEYTPQIKNIKNISKYQKSIINTNQANQLIIHLLKPTNWIEIIYEVHAAQPSQILSIQEFLLKHDLLHIPGHAMLAVPEEANNSQKLNIKITWEGLPKQWGVISSHGQGNSLNFTATLRELVHAVYAAGIIRQYTQYIGNKAVNFLLYGKLDFSDQKIIDIALKIIKSQRAFFNDYDFNNYLISIIEDPSGTDNLASMEGISLYNSFVGYISKGIDLKQYQLLLAHEHLHNWIGEKIHNTEETLNYWWSEGFTDYYSRILAARDGSLNFNDFFVEVNNILGEYYRSPAINLSNSEITDSFWNDQAIYRMPYLRGFIFALYLNCKIKPLDQQEATDAVLMDFWYNHKTKGFSNKNFITLLKKHNGSVQNIEQDFYNYIEEGNTIELDNCACVLPIKRSGLSDLNKKAKRVYYLPTNLSDKERKQIIKFFNIRN